MSSGTRRSAAGPAVINRTRRVQVRRFGREPMGISLDKSARNRSSGLAGVGPVPETAPVSTAGSEGMSLKFEIQPAPNAMSEKERMARLVDPGFGRVFTDHMAV